MTVNEWIKDNKAKVNNRYKPKFHFTAPIGWINDPNGFVYFKGEYHLFYQYHPYSAKWGPMHWGHAKSSDLIHWEHLPVALAPDQPYDKGGCFSGTALAVDDELILMYTGHVDENGNIRQVQCLARSFDGIHFQKYEQNPVIDERHVTNTTDFRDPKIFKRSDKYYSLVASTENNIGNVLLFESDDLENWMFKSVFLSAEKNQGKIWECPDLFSLGGKDVLIVSPIAYQQDGFRFANVNSSVWFIGEVDWEKGKFVTETVEEIDSGLDFYAPQTLLDDKNRRIMIAWEQMWGRSIPTDDLGHNWAGSMTIPRQLTYKEGKIRQEFVSEFYDQFQLIDEKEVENDFETEIPPLLEAEFRGDFILKIGTADEYVEISCADQTITVNRSQSGYLIKDGENVSDIRQCQLSSEYVKIALATDVSTSDLIINNDIVFSNTFYPKEEIGKIRIQSEQFIVSTYREKIKI